MAPGASTGRMAVRIAAWLAAALLCGLAVGAQASTRVRVIDTWPAGTPVQLAAGQSFYLRLAYDSDEPLQLTIRPLWRGAPAEVGVSLSRAYQGRGEALQSFFFLRPNARVDEIRIVVDDGARAAKPQELVWHGEVIGGARAAAQAPPAWLNDLLAQERLQRQQEHAQRRPPRPPARETLQDMGLTLALASALAAGLALPLWGLWSWRGAWRLAAALPAAAMVFMLLKVLTDATSGTHARARWPFEITLTGWLCAVAMAALWLLRRRRAGDLAHRQGQSRAEGATRSPDSSS